MNDQIDDTDWVEPTPEQIAERAARANRATRGALAANLCLEAVSVLLIPRAIAQTSVGLHGATIAFLVALSLVMIVTAFMLRRPWGIGLGSVLQVVLLGASVLVPTFLLVAVVFAGVWLFVLNARQRLVGTPSGWRMLIS